MPIIYEHLRRFFLTFRSDITQNFYRKNMIARLKVWNIKFLNSLSIAKLHFPEVRALKWFLLFCHHRYWNLIFRLTKPLQEIYWLYGKLCFPLSINAVFLSCEMFRLSVVSCEDMKCQTKWLLPNFSTTKLFKSFMFLTLTCDTKKGLVIPSLKKFAARKMFIQLHRGLSKYWFQVLASSRWSFSFLAAAEFSDLRKRMLILLLPVLNLTSPTNMSISYEQALACKFFFSKGQNLEARFQTAVKISKPRYFLCSTHYFQFTSSLP